MDVCENIVVSSRIRLARNVRGVNFFTQLTDIETAEGITKAVYGAINGSEEFTFQRLKNLSYNACMALFERHTISRELIENKDISSYAISDDWNVIVMICEEDHIREQSIYKGFDLFTAYERINLIDDKILGNLEIAFNNELGFVTASPSNLGTGMRASCMMFLPALCKKGKIDDMTAEAGQMGLTVRGIFGEGTGALGYYYQVSNQNSLGMTEDEIIDSVSEFVLKICEREHNLRESLLAENYDDLKNSAFRAYGLLKYSHILTEDELYLNLSELKLGVVLGLITLKKPEGLDYLYYEAGRANLYEKFGENVKRKENLLRAEYISGKIERKGD